jgi:hypothetical protein
MGSQEADRMSALDFTAVYQGLKDFQRSTVDHVFKRMYLDNKPAKRFLIADEVGLGKTLVARGLIAKAVEHLTEQGVQRIDVIYICSNAEIAAQNIKRLTLPGFEQATYTSRLTMLPLELRDLSKNRLNFVSFTPSTALELKGNLGRREERVLLYWLLKRKWPDLVGTKRGPARVFQGGMGSVDGFLDLYRRYEPQLRQVDRGLRNQFYQDLAEYDRQSRKRGEPTIKARLEYLAKAWARKGRKSPEDAHERSRFVGDLRSLLARTCIGALEPDLVILDEFQRFRHLLDEGSEAAELAHSLFNYTSTDGGARVLLLSATPYKMYTLAEESLDDDHYRDFLHTTGFLMNGKGTRFTEQLAEYRERLLQLEPDNLEQLLQARKRIETSLRKVMCRTERLGVGPDRNGMLSEITSSGEGPTAEDILNYVALDRAAGRLHSTQPMEYWKSAPYFANFWDGYQIGREFQSAVGNDPATAIAVRQTIKDSLLPWKSYEGYQPIDPGNSRLRQLSAELIEKDAWKILWLPPCLSYYALGKPFVQAANANLTKRLVFSAWNATPKALSSILSYEAERRMMTARKKSGLVNSPEVRKNIPEALRFPVKQTSGMSAVAFMYPSPTLAAAADPLLLGRHLRDQGSSPTADKVIALAGQRLLDLLTKRINELEVKIDGPSDDRWYWVAPLLLDFESPSQEHWLYQDNLAQAFAGRDGGGKGFENHLEAAVAIDSALSEKSLTMGGLPEDLGKVLALLAIGGPGTNAYRALRRLVPTPAADLELAIRDAAARIAWSMRSLFNTPEVTYLIRALERGQGPYWQQALAYCVAGCLQSTFDEYLHVLREFEGLLGDVDIDAIRTIADRASDVISLRSVDLQANDPLDEEDSARRMRCRFALPFGQYHSEEEKQLRRSTNVRSAFNSPFWPFVLTTTSVGQEGLDFHLYCHAVVHWNLPANPVDLEQREGRVHRYLGHAVRKNLAVRHGDAALGTSGDPWKTMLSEAVAGRGNENDLVPYWIYPGPAKIERHVPRFPLSREEGRLVDLRRSLALYRLVMGQPRQEELIALLKDLSPEQAEQVGAALRIDLSPLRGAPVKSI